MQKSYRYPGTLPFSEKDHALFFGRNEDIARFTKQIQHEDLMVLFGKSGLGKTSLLNAGVLPRLVEDYKYSVVQVRFGAYQRDSEQTLSDIFREKLAEGVRLKNYITEKVLGFTFDAQQELVVEGITREELAFLESPWLYLKSKALEEPTIQSFLFVFDQFEEIFTYPNEQIEAFSNDLAMCLNVKVPQQIRAIVREKMKVNRTFLERDEMTQLFDPLEVKTILSIRSDKMSLLDRLKDKLPNILQQCYELEPLSLEQGKEAILAPAQLVSEHFTSPTFGYTTEAVQTILSFLSEGGKTKIEAFQLQILCSYIEHLVIDNGYSVIKPEHFGSIESVYKNFYDNLIGRLPEGQQLLARVLIEEGLIFEEEERRLSLFEGQILTNYKVDKQLLVLLVNTHLLRIEPHSSGSVLYEISHDTLVVPILLAKQRRLQAALLTAKVEEQMTQEAVKQEEKRALLQKRFRLIILAVLLLLIGVIGYSSSTISNKNQQLKLVNSELRETNSVLYTKLDEISSANASLDTLLELTNEDELNSLAEKIAFTKKVVDTTKVKAFRKSRKRTLAGVTDVLNDVQEKAAKVLESKNYKKAVAIYKKISTSKKKFNAVENFEEGEKYRTGKGVAVDEKKALKYYENAACEGHGMAQYNAGLLQFKKENTRTARKWWIKAAKQNLTQAQRRLINYYLVNGDYKKAIPWLESLSEKKDIEAQYQLGFCYEHGKGVKLSVETAIYWYELAAKNGSEKAKANLASLQKAAAEKEEEVEAEVEEIDK